MPKDLNDLRRDRRAAADTMLSTLAVIEALEAALPGADASAEDQAAHAANMEEAQAAHDAAVAAHKAADAAVRRREEAEASAASSATSEAGGTAPTSGVTVPGASQPAQAANPADVGADVGLMMAALASARGSRDDAMRRLEAAGQSGISAALSGASDSAGGVTVPRPQSETFIGLLNARVALMRAPVQTFDMPAGEVRMARAVSGPTASYGAENGATVESEPTFEAVEPKFRTLSSLVPIGNALLRHSSASIGRVVRDLMLEAMALKKDIGLLRYDGTGNNPKGVLNWALPGHILPTVANTAAAVETAIRSIVNIVEESNVMMAAPGWIMRPGARNFLAALRHPTTGFKIFPEIDNSGTLAGFPIYTTTQLPNNLGAGTNETEVMFIDFAEIGVGSSQEITIATSTEAAFVDQGGNTVSAFQRGLTLMRAVEEHDLVPMHDEAIGVINAANWSL